MSYTESIYRQLQLENRNFVITRWSCQRESFQGLMLVLACPSCQSFWAKAENKHTWSKQPHILPYINRSKRSDQFLSSPTSFLVISSDQAKVHFILVRPKKCAFDQFSCPTTTPGFGVPEYLTVDEGTEFKAEFSKLCADAGIVVFKTASKAPWMQGRVERHGGLYKTMLAHARESMPPGSHAELLRLM